MGVVRNSVGKSVNPVSWKVGASRRGLPYPATLNPQVWLDGTTYNDSGTIYYKDKSGRGNNIPVVSGVGLNTILDLSVLSDTRFDKSNANHYKQNWTYLYYDSNNPYHWKLSDFHYRHFEDEAADLTNIIFASYYYQNGTNNGFKKLFIYAYEIDDAFELYNVKQYIRIEPPYWLEVYNDGFEDNINNFTIANQGTGGDASASHESSSPIEGNGSLRLSQTSKPSEDYRPNVKWQTEHEPEENEFFELVFNYSVLSGQFNISSINGVVYGVVGDNTHLKGNSYSDSGQIILDGKCNAGGDNIVLFINGSISNFDVLFDNFNLKIYKTNYYYEEIQI